jgi:hypothetical protein
MKLSPRDPAEKAYYRKTALAVTAIGSLLMLRCIQFARDENSIPGFVFGAMFFTATALLTYGLCGTILGAGACHLPFFASSRKKPKVPTIEVVEVAKEANTHKKYN